MSWFLLLPLKDTIVHDVICMEYVCTWTFYTVIICIHILVLSQLSLRTLAVQFNLQEKPICWHYVQLSTYLGSITVNCRIYRLIQYISLHGWKVKLTLCLTSTTWLRCSWGKATHTHIHTLNLSTGGECSSSCNPGKCIPYQLDRWPHRPQRWSWYISEKEIFALGGHDSQAM